MRIETCFSSEGLFIVSKYKIPALPAFFGHSDANHESHASWMLFCLNKYKIQTTIVKFLTSISTTFISLSDIAATKTK